MISQIEVREKYENKYWRLNNLYWIIDKKGQRVPFRLNEMQEIFYDNLWYLNVLLKARQWGGTTFTDIYFLDECLWNPNVEAGIIAHNKEDAKKIFRRKVKYPYDNLPDQIKSRVYPLTDSKEELALSNNSTIYVGTSMRSGTLQYLHISEHGKICSKYPEKAEEIMSGSLNAVDPGQMIIIESTAEGATGDFYDICQTALERSKTDTKLTELDYKFHFIAWFLNPENEMDPDGVTINQDMSKYLLGVEKLIGRNLSARKKAWYAKKAELQGSRMKREYPSTPEEAFEGAKRAFDFSIAHHVVKPLPIPEHAQVYMTFDWGFGKPYSCGYWWVDADGRVYRFSELYGAKKNEAGRTLDEGPRASDSLIAEDINEHEKKIGMSSRKMIRLCDPTCFNRKPDYKGGGQLPSTGEVFAGHGIYMSPGDPSRSLKFRQFNERLRVYTDKAPMMQIYSTCPEFIRTIPLLNTDKINPDDVDTTQEDHIYDEACHVCMVRPLTQGDSKPLDPIEDRIRRLERGGDNQEQYEIEAITDQRRDEYSKAGVSGYDETGVF